MNLQTHSASNTQSSKAPAILQTASLLAFVQYAAHGSLFLLSITAHPSPIAAIAASSHHSYWDFYVGYGLLAILSGVIEAVLLWQVALLAKNDAARVRPIVVLFIFANLAHAGLVWRDSLRMRGRTARDAELPLPRLSTIHRQSFFSGCRRALYRVQTDTRRAPLPFSFQRNGRS